jgi:hypothetical protein
MEVAKAQIGAVATKKKQGIYLMTIQICGICGKYIPNEGMLDNKITEEVFTCT